MPATLLGGAPVVHRSRGVVRISVALATDATADGGDVAATVIGPAFGRIVGLLTNGGFDASAVITVTDQRTGATVLTFTTGTEGTPQFIRPTKGISDTAGEAVAAALTATNTNRDIKVAGKLSISVANMGQSETGTFVLIVDESVPGLGTKSVNV